MKEVKGKATDAAYEKLVNGIILTAVDDYRIALRMLKKKPRDSNARGMKMSVERFFKSDWFTVLTAIDGKMLIRKLKEEVK
ncbi:hypothetical protein [Frisingicoccus sp.]|uniref:hypothetical protein n=1 Tax=Frisingicoccus sp. TaxID=1918627 RepID=UPI0039922CED